MLVSDVMVMPVCPIHAPIWTLTHPRDNSVHRVFAPFFQSLAHGLEPLFVRSKIEKTVYYVRECHVAVLEASVLKNWSGKNT